MNDPVAHSYSRANAAELCRASADAYEVSRDDEFYVVSVDTDTCATITETATDLIVAFRGTTDLRNWLTDLDCAFVPGEGHIRLHAGFAAALDSVQGKITDYIFKSGYKSKRMWLTGHSLGGALAMLYALRWTDCEMPQPFSGVYTFGQPRVGDGAFRDLYNAELLAKTFRVIHADDVVARVPWLLGRYRHAGHEVFYPVHRHDAGRDRSEAEPMIDAPWLRKLPSDLRGAAEELCIGQLALLNDHHVNTYLSLFSDSLKTNEKQSPAAVSAMQAAPDADYSGAPQGAGATL